MKKMIFVLASLLLSFSSFSFAAEKQIVATVDGMVCAFCAQGITKKFQAEPSVDKVDVSLEKKSVTLSLKEGKNIDDKSITALLKDSGYNVSKIERH